MTAVLEIEGLETFYGASQALFGVGLRIEQGEMVTLLGRTERRNRWTNVVDSVYRYSPGGVGAGEFCIARQLIEHAEATTTDGRWPRGRAPSRGPNGPLEVHQCGPVVTGAPALAVSGDEVGENHPKFGGQRRKFGDHGKIVT